MHCGFRRDLIERALGTLDLRRLHVRPKEKTKKRGLFGAPRCKRVEILLGDFGEIIVEALLVSF